MIPEGLLPIGFQYMVAGGWAVCPALASDTDVFVLMDQRDEYLDIRSLIVSHLRYNKFVFEEQDDTRTADSPGECDALIRKVAKVQYHGRVIHVLIGLTTNPEAILNTFDLSICQVGILLDGTIVKGENYTSPAEEIRILRPTPTTDNRAEKYKARFNLSAVEV